MIGFSSRRAFLRGVALLAGATAVVPLLQACGGAPATPTTAAAPTVAPAAKPTEAPKPAATTAPAAATSPTAAAKPTEAVKPAAQPTAAAKPAAAAEGTIRYTFWAAKEEADVMGKVAEGLMKKNPKIKVNLEHNPKDYWTKLQAGYAAGAAPDVMWINDNNMPNYASENSLEDLGPFISGDAEFKLGQLTPSVVQAFQFQGKHYGLPWGYSTYTIYYNKKLFADAGVQTPTEQRKAGKWTFETFLDTATKLTKGEGPAKVYGFAFENWEPIWHSFLVANKGGIITDDGKLILDSPESVETLQWLADLRNKLKVSPTIESMSQVGSSDLFMAGRVAMTIYGTWQVPVFRNITAFDWDIEIMPTGKQQGTLADGIMNSISVQSKAKEAAWEFVKYAVSEEGQKLIATLGEAIPSHAGVAESTAWLDPKTKPSNKQAFTESLAFAKWAAKTPKRTKIAPIVGQTVNDLWLGKKTAAEVVAKIKEDTKSILGS